MSLNVIIAMITYGAFGFQVRESEAPYTPCPGSMQKFWTAWCSVQATFTAPQPLGNPQMCSADGARLLRNFYTVCYLAGGGEDVGEETLYATQISLQIPLVPLAFPLQ